MVKEFLSQRGVVFSELDVSENKLAAQELINKTGQMAVPVTLINGQVIIGFNQQELKRVLMQQKPIFGASLADARKITARSQTKPVFGAYVGRVRPGSVAEKLGLVPGDIIKSLNSQSINNVDDFESAINRLNRGAPFSLVFYRDGQQITNKATI